MEEFSFVEELLTVGDGILSRIKQLSFLRLRLLAPLDEKTYLDQHWAEEREKEREQVEQSSDNRCVLADCPRTCLLIVF